MAKRKTPSSLQSPPQHQHPSAGLLRRLGALLYDYLVVIALLIIAGFIGMGVAYLLLATGMATVPEGKDAAWLLTSPLYSAWLALVICGFYTWFWTRAGQTIGMRAWRLRVVDRNGASPGWGAALLRFVVAQVSLALFCLGFLWCLFERERRGWHDLASGTRVLREPKR